jgi:hypothetical protein
VKGERGAPRGIVNNGARALCVPNCKHESSVVARQKAAKLQKRSTEKMWSNLEILVFCSEQVRYLNQTVAARHFTGLMKKP